VLDEVQKVSRSYVIEFLSCLSHASVQNGNRVVNGHNRINEYHLPSVRGILMLSLTSSLLIDVILSNSWKRSLRWIHKSCKLFCNLPKSLC